MNYAEALKKHQLRNLSQQLNGPTLARVDINVPVESDGRISRDKPNLRLEYYSSVVELYSEFAPVVLMAHQGRVGEREFIPLQDHATILGYLMKNARVTYEPRINGEEYFSDRLVKRIRGLEKGEVFLLANAREFDFEKIFDPTTCKYISFFKKAGIATCVNDGGPLWHRANSSIMALPHISKTYVGIRSYNELKIQHQIMNDKGTKGIVIGGKKPKFEVIPKLAERMDIFTGGLTAQIVCRLKGYDLGEKNNSYLERLYKPYEFEILRHIINKYDIVTPTDFVVLSDGDRHEKDIEELGKKDWLIRDIGSGTRDIYATRLQNYDWRIRAGPLGVFEDGYNNGSRLLRSILGTGFVALGGDTVEELQKNNLVKRIEDTGGVILLGGGAHLDGWAGIPYPSLDELLKLQG